MVPTEEPVPLASEVTVERVDGGLVGALELDSREVKAPEFSVVAPRKLEVEGFTYSKELLPLDSDAEGLLCSSVQDVVSGMGVEEEGKPVLKGPTLGLLEDAKTPDPDPVEVWLCVGYGTLEVLMIEVKPPEAWEVCVVDLLDFVLDSCFDLEWWCDPVPVGPVVTVEFEIVYGAVVDAPSPEDMLVPPDTVDDGAVPVSEMPIAEEVVL
jgi:hypothetical protein